MPGKHVRENSILIRIDKDTHCKLKRLAAEDRRTMVTVIRKSLNSYEAAR